ncbi:hypothetical protein B0H11DRAFT_2059722 [Mycena galericulata]|nr:hypothetical protein B0H11DRAFT_2059722 [Mycena galericulata]
MLLRLCLVLIAPPGRPDARSSIRCTPPVPSCCRNRSATIKTVVIHNSIFLFVSDVQMRSDHFPLHVACKI